MTTLETLRSEMATGDEWLSRHRGDFLQYPNGSTLFDALTAKVAAVDERTFRITRSDHDFGYTTDPLFVRTATRHVLAALTHDSLRNLTFSHDLSASAINPNPQMLLVFNHDAPGNKVLKIYGRERANEARLQQELSAAGLQIINVSDFDMDVEGGWMLMDLLPGKSLETLWKQKTPDIKALWQATEKVAAIARNIHDHSPRMPITRTVIDGMGIHVRIAIEQLTKAGIGVDEDLWSFFEATSIQRSQHLLHGDISAGNAISNHGDITLIDASGYIGPRSFDAANWIIRVGVPHNATADVAESWIRTEPELDADELLSCVAIEAWRNAGLQKMFQSDSTSPDADVTKQLLQIARNSRDALQKSVTLPDVPAMIRPV